MKEEIYRFEWRRYKKGAFGFVFVEIEGNWVRSHVDWELIKKRGVLA